MSDDLVENDGFAAALAHHARVANVIPVAEHRWRSLRSRSPTVAPIHDGQQKHDQLASALGEAVVHAYRVLLVDALGQQFDVHQLAQASREHLARDAQILGEVVEASDAQKDVAENQRSPRVAQEREGAADGASNSSHALSIHPTTILGSQGKLTGLEWVP